LQTEVSEFKSSSEGHSIITNKTEEAHKLQMTEIQIINDAIHASILAGIEIMKVYQMADLKIQIKEDKTPVTLADFMAHKVILKELECTGIPVLSEESTAASYEKRRNWKLFWMIDPLDGTKEFIKRNDEFTVNIALIEHGLPIAGVIFAPVSRVLYTGIPGIGAFKLLNPDLDCNFQTIQNEGTKLPEMNSANEFIVAVSRSHINQETEKYIENIRQYNRSVRIVRKGSSLKICMVAEGTADIYPKIGKTMEWDTAAGHAIVKAAGKNIFLPDTKTELTYNKQDLHNPHFIVK
jgi:3'(2'), 5'-bisphosphate nucleotidase